MNRKAVMTGYSLITCVVSICIIVTLFLKPLKAQENLLKYKLEFSPSSIKVGDTLSVMIHMDIADGHHVYAPTSENKAQGLQITELRFLPILPKGLIRIGRPTMQYRDGMEILLEGAGKGIQLIQKFKYTGNSELEEMLLKGKFVYQICDLSVCYPPVEIPFTCQVKLKKDGDHPIQLKATADSDWEQIMNSLHILGTDEKRKQYTQTKIPIDKKRFEDNHWLNVVGLTRNFWNNYPTDPRKIKAMTLYLSADPYFISKTANLALDTMHRIPNNDFGAFMRLIVKNKGAEDEWIEEGNRMIASILKEGNAEECETASYAELARDFRLASRNYYSLPRKDVEQDYWLAIETSYFDNFFKRFINHAYTYADLDCISERAIDFLNLMKNVIPLRIASYWSQIEQISSLENSKSGMSKLNKTAKDYIASQKVELGQVPLDFSFNSMSDGKLIDLKELRGNIIVIDFWATWCKPCIDEFSSLKRLYDVYKEKGFEILGVCLDDSVAKKRVETVLLHNQVSWPQRFEGKGFKNDTLSVQFGLNSLPTVWLLDRDGKIISKNARGKVLEEMLEKLFSE